MASPYRPVPINEVARHVDEEVMRIQAEECQVTQPPETATRKARNLRFNCHAKGINAREARG
jgi:hypothetical protein